MKVKLHRMSGLGNDFLIYDARSQETSINSIVQNITTFSDRSNLQTKGCDQFIIINHAQDADIYMQIFNADGSEVSACGNATRCVGLKISEELSKKIISIKTNADKLISENLGDNLISVNMGIPKFNWQEIPLAQNFNYDEIPIKINGFASPSVVNMGNPHIVFFTDEIDINNFDVVKYGSPIEEHKLFPQKTNVEFAKIIDAENIRMRVFERGVGETLACGTGACATAVIAYKKGLVKSEVNIHMNGGILKIKYPDENNQVIMIGNVKDEGLIFSEIWCS